MTIRPTIEEFLPAIKHLPLQVLGRGSRGRSISLAPLRGVNLDRLFYVLKMHADQHGLCATRTDSRFYIKHFRSIPKEDFKRKDVT